MTDGTRMDVTRRGQSGRDDGLAGLIRARVDQRASGRIRDLDVACRGGRITLRGRSRTQYAKQLAHQAVLDFAGIDSELANQIEVG